MGYVRWYHKTRDRRRGEEEERDRKQQEKGSKREGQRRKEQEDEEEKGGKKEKKGGAVEGKKGDGEEGGEQESFRVQASRTCSQVCLFLSTGHKRRSSGKRGPQLRKMSPPDWPISKPIRIEMRDPGTANSAQVVLGIGKQVE